MVFLLRQAALAPPGSQPAVSKGGDAAPDGCRSMVKYLGMVFKMKIPYVLPYGKSFVFKGLLMFMANMAKISISGSKKYRI